MEAIHIICLSYCWLSDDHPDPDGYHLQLSLRFSSVAKGARQSTRGATMSRVSASAMAQSRGAKEVTVGGVMLAETSKTWEISSSRRWPAGRRVHDGTSATVELTTAEKHLSSQYEDH